MILIEKSTKIVIGIIVFGFVLPCAIILKTVDRHDKWVDNLAGIRDYKAGRYDAATQELSAYVKVHPLATEHGYGYGLPGKSTYAEHYLGLALLKQRRYAEAVSIFRVYTQYRGDNEGRYWLGVALMDNGNRAEARPKFKEAMDGEMGEPMHGRNEALVKACDKKIDRIDQAH